MLEVSKVTSSKKKENKSLMADIYGEVIFLLIPILGLVFVAAVKNSESIKLFFLNLLTTSDWSLMSALIFGQCAHKMSKVVPKMEGQVGSGPYSFYVAKRIALIIVSLLMYALITFSPNIYLGGIQMLIFMISIYFFMKDSVASKILLKKIEKIHN